MADVIEPPPPYLVVQGDSTDVQVLNLLNMQLAKVFKHRSKVVGICVTPPSFQRQSYVMTLTELGGLYLWDLEKPMQPVSAMRLTKMLGLTSAAPNAPTTSSSSSSSAGGGGGAAPPAVSASGGGGTVSPPSAPMCIAVSNDGMRFLVVMKYHWVVASFKDFKMESPLMASAAQSYPSDVHWIGGSFLLDSERVVLWTSTGYIDAYVLTPTAPPTTTLSTSTTASTSTSTSSAAPTPSKAGSSLMPSLDLTTAHGTAYHPPPSSSQQQQQQQHQQQPSIPTATPNALLHAQPSGFFSSFMSGHGPAIRHRHPLPPLPLSPLLITPLHHTHTSRSEKG